MASEERSHGFWGSFAGVLTAIAGLLTAIAGLMVALKTMESSTPAASSSSPTSSSSTALTSTASPPSAVVVTPPSSPKIPINNRDQGTTQAKEQNGDWVHLTSISPPPGTKLVTGVDTPIKLSVEYMLKSANSARLFAQIVQFDGDSGSPCEGGGHIPDATSVPIVAGKGSAEIEVVWHGGRSKNVQPEVGYIAPMFSVWQANQHEPISHFDVFSKACYRFAQ